VDDRYNVKSSEAAMLGAPSPAGPAGGGANLDSWGKAPLATSDLRYKLAERFSLVNCCTSLTTVVFAALIHAKIIENVCFVNVCGLEKRNLSWSW
jgi:hypothetical protein